jgi:hypothetical protein
MVSYHAPSSRSIDSDIEVVPASNMPDMFGLGDECLLIEPFPVDRVLVVVSDGKVENLETDDIVKEM